MSKAFPKIWNLDAPEVERLFVGPVEITEKVDGSQFAFGWTKDGFTMRSKHKELFKEDHDKLFDKAVSFALKCDAIHPFSGTNMWYFEFLDKPKHNTLAYDRVPKNNLVLFGIIYRGFMINSYSELVDAADRIGTDVVPLLFQGEIKSKDSLEKLLETESFLGNQKVEGIVIKNYNERSLNAYSPEVFGKLVRPEFREINKVEHKSRRFTAKDFVNQFKSEARWNKAFQHLRECGLLTYTPRDIGILIKSVKDDVIEEERESIEKTLLALYKESILSNSVKGIAEWYKDKLLREQFDEPNKGNKELSV